MGKPRVFGRFIAHNSTRVVLREPESEDLEGLLAFVNELVTEKKEDKNSQLFTGFESRLDRRQESKWLRELLARIRDGGVLCVLAEVDGQIVGNGEIVRGEYAETRHHGRLALTIDETHRGLGIGREMLKALLTEAGRVGLKTVHVEFLSTNKSALRAYRKTGFKKVGTIPKKVYRNGTFVDSLIMARDL
ncbi:hypothetical protein AUG19_08600 [archaeon 13_1_20CM_2_54_9]|nr:MAG: hypothetical protein AUG19_08600 [archaeon 13_1_20CM_2_54_9]